MDAEQQLDDTRTALIFVCIPLAPVFVVSPFMINGVYSILAWIEIALLFLLLILWASKWIRFGLFFSLIVSLALLSCFVAGIISAVAHYKEARAEAPLEKFANIVADYKEAREEARLKEFSDNESEEQDEENISRAQKQNNMRQRRYQ